jgi:hypothetical protein
VQAVVILAGPTMDADGYDNPSYRGSTLNGPSFKGICDIVVLNGTTIPMKYGPGEVNEAPFLVRSEAINGVNFGDGIADNERYGMRRFIYNNNYNPGIPTYGQPYPLYAPEYYKTMDGRWADSTKMIYGGNGHQAVGGTGPECDFMFPGLTDTCEWGIQGHPPNGPKEWTETTAMNPPGDRHGVASTGPFTFKPGDIQELDLAFAWARNNSSLDPVFSKINAVVDTIRRNFRDNSIPGGGLFYGITNRELPKVGCLKIFPNPAKDRIFIETPAPGSQMIEISLITSLGKTVRSALLLSSGKDFSLDLTGIPEGFYIVSVRSGSDVWMDKVIVTP